MNDGIRKAALVFPVYNRRDITLQTLRSLKRLDTSGLSIRIFVVDDASTDGTAEAVRTQFPEVMLIQGTGSLHYAAGTNRGIAEALKWNPDYIVAANDDSVFASDFLKSMVAAADSNPHSIVGALLLLWNDPHKVFQVGQRWKSFKGGWVFPNDLTAFTVPSEPFEVECIVGNCVLFPTEAILENGLMDERRFPYGWGDAQYLIRLRKAGWRLIIDPRARVWCEPNTYPPPLHSMSIKEALRALFIDKRHPLNLNRQFAARWHSAPTKPKAVVAFIVYFLIIALKGVQYSLLRFFRFLPNRRDS